MENLQVTQVALGKAHAVALTSKGVVYTFGINNKGQCGRDFVTQVKEGIASNIMLCIFVCIIL